MTWIQKDLVLPPKRRGCYLVTDSIVDAIPEVQHIETGLLNLFIQHTSASLTINENADPDVRVDLESLLNAVVPEQFPYTHTLEGRDYMPAHVKASFLGCSLNIPVSSGRLALGTWQGVYMCEHRDHAAGRHILLTLQGVSR